MKKKILSNINKEKKLILRTITKSFFWFLIGAFLGLFFLISFTFIIFQNKYNNLIYPGVIINGTDFGGKTKEDIVDFFKKKNNKITDTQFTFTEGEEISTISAKEINLGFDENLMSEQAYSIGRSKNLLSNLTLITQAYINGVELSSSYHYLEDKLIESIEPISKTVNIEPKEALFTFQNGKVIAFQASSNGQKVDIEEFKNKFNSKIPFVIYSEKPEKITVKVPIKIVKPKITTDKANNLGIKEIISTGTSLFSHSISNRIYNITLAATRLNGILIAPNEVFSFNKAIGDISAFTGYKQAYVIQNGRTVLGDGGGVCQVSTTFFRAALNAGLPIVERHAHAYRVSYYEQDSGPGLDATVFYPSVDLKVKNDTGNYVLIQTLIEPEYERLTFTLYGTKDGREVNVTKPVILSQSPPLEPLYQDDPELPKGIVKQVDYPAWGANVYFTRQVKKNGKVVISDKFISNYRSWQAVYLRGTKE